MAEYIDTISRQAAIDALDVLCQEHRYKIPGKWETYSQYNEAWQDALDRAEGAIFNLPPAQLEIVRCKDCIHYDPAINGYNGICNRQYATFYADDFCSHGTRKGGDAE